MRAIERSLIDQFARAFCYQRKGFSLREIPDFFSSYQGNIPSLASYSVAIDKSTVFSNCVSALSPENQRQALYDLCDCPPPSQHPMPSEDERRRLLHLLVQADGVSPLSIELSSLTVDGVRKAWFTAASRIHDSPSAAISAARTLVESTCKTILRERDIQPDQSGELSRLFRQVRDALSINPRRGDTQYLYTIVNGSIQMIEGLSGLSNRVGDRHGLDKAQKLGNIPIAGLAVHSAGTISLFLSGIHRLSMRGDFDWKDYFNTDVLADNSM